MNRNAAIDLITQKTELTRDSVRGLVNALACRWPDRPLTQLAETLPPSADVDWRQRAEVAEADVAALRAVCTGLLECFEHNDPWTKQAKAGAADSLRGVLADHPGAALLAELAAARAVVAAAKAHPGCLVNDDVLDAAVDAYDRAAKGQSDGDL